jgi:hypothetical protein
LAGPAQQQTDSGAFTVSEDRWKLISVNERNFLDFLGFVVLFAVLRILVMLDRRDLQLLCRFLDGLAERDGFGSDSGRLE